MQYFKGDAIEKKYEAAGAPILDALSIAKDEFFDGAYEAANLGDILYDDMLAPLANAISRDIYRSHFNDIFDAFVVAGAFESYLDVFRKIFGNDVDVVFTVPAPGKLVIDITATGLEVSDFVARRIVGDSYVFEDVVDYGGDHILFQTVIGFKTQYELEQMLFEMVPGGIFTDINLTIA